MLRNVWDGLDESSSDLIRMLPTKLAVESCRSGFSYQTVEQIIEIIEQVENFDSRRKWLKTRFSERGESKELISKFNDSVLTKPETILSGASRGPIAKLLLDDIKLRYPTMEEKRPYALHGIFPKSREYILR